MTVTEKIGTLDSYEMDGVSIVQIVIRLQSIMQDAKERGYSNLTVKEEGRYGYGGYSRDELEMVIYGEREETEAEKKKREAKEAALAARAAKERTKERERAKKARTKAKDAAKNRLLKTQQDRKELFEQLKQEFGN